MKEYINKTNIILALILIGFVWFVHEISSILLPFVLAFVLAYILSPLVDKLEKRHLNRRLATAIIGCVFCFGIIALFLLLIPLLRSQLIEFIQKIPKYSAAVWNHIRVVLAYAQDNIPQDRLANLSDSVSNSISRVLMAIGTGLIQVFSSGAAMLNLLGLIVITPVVLFYLLYDWNNICDKIGGSVPKKYEEKIGSLWGEINKTLAGFIRGQSLVCFSLAVYYAIGLSMVGLEFGALVGLLTGILSFIPYFGFGSGLVVSLLLALVQGLTGGQWVGLACVFGFGQILEGYILTPRLVGKQVGLHPVWIIFSLLVGGTLLGFMGILIAVPLAAVIGVLIRHLYAWYQTTDFYKGNSSK